MRTPSFCLFICLSLALPVGLNAQQSSSSDPLKDLVPMQMNWDAAKSDDNKKPVPAMKFVAYKTEHKDGKVFTSYYVYVPGLPQNSSYTLLSWQIGWDAAIPPFQPEYSGLYVNKKNVILCKKPEGAEDDSDAPAIDEDRRLNTIVASAKGEPMRYALLSEKGEIVAMGTLVNHPIEATDKACHLQVIRALGGAEILLAEGTGFSPKSKVVMTRDDGRGTKSATFTVDENGRIETPVILLAPGVMKGTATVSIKSDICAPSVKFDWGHDTYQVQ